MASGVDANINVQLETFLEEFEVLLTKTYGEDWYYTFDVEEGVLLHLSIPYTNEDNEDEE